jgi:hypothetical protein
MDPYHFGMPDSDPQQSEKLDPDPNQSQKPDPDLLYGQNSTVVEAQNEVMRPRGHSKVEAWRLKMEQWRICRSVIVDSHGSATLACTVVRFHLWIVDIYVSKIHVHRNVDVYVVPSYTCYVSVRLRSRLILYY